MQTGRTYQPGQKDLTKWCLSTTAVNPAVLSWNWDEIALGGSNTGDGCALYDTDNDGLANYSLRAPLAGQPDAAGR